MKHPDFYINPARIEEEVRVSGIEQVCNALNYLKDYGKAMLKLYWLKNAALREDEKLLELNKKVEYLLISDHFVDALEILRNRGIGKYSKAWIIKNDDDRYVTRFVAPDS